MSVRSLRRSPGYAIATIVTLTLAIGANSAIFTLANALLFSNMPVSHPDRLFEISTRNPKGEKGGFSIPMFQQMEKARIFSSIFAWNGGGMENLEMNGSPFAGSVDEIAGNYYSTLGIRPALGRFITPADIGLEHFTPSAVAVIGYRTWQLRFGGNPDVIGKRIQVDGKSYTVIGVHPKTFPGLIREVSADATIPITAYMSDAEHVYSPTHTYNTIIGRLRAGATQAQANAALQVIWPRLKVATAPESWPDRSAFLKLRVELEPAAYGISYLHDQFIRPLYTMLAVVGLLLLLACLNLATVALARAQGRAGEFSIQAALGGTRWRIFRASLLEGVLLAGLGVIPGLAVAFWGSRYIASFMWHGYVPLALSLEPNATIILFTACIAVIAAILFGTIPSWRAATQEPAAALQQANTRVLGKMGMAAPVLILSQVALSFCILAGALLFASSLARLRSAGVGFDAGHLLIAQLFPKKTYKGFDQASYEHHLLQSLKETAGVKAAALARSRPVGADWKETIVPGNRSATYHLVSPGFFEAMGMHLLRGTDFSTLDGPDTPKVAIVSLSLASKLSPRRDPIGQRLKIGELKGEFRVIGIVNDAILGDPRAHRSDAIYANIFQRPDYLGWSEVVVSTVGNPEQLRRAIRSTIDSLGREYPLEIETVNQEYDFALRPERMIAILSGFFGTIGLSLAAVGLYGLLSYSVSRRTGEIGLRLALGATRASVLILILQEIAALLALGLALGLGLLLAAGKFTQSFLYGFSSHNPKVLGLSAAVLSWLRLLQALRRLPRLFAPSPG